MFDPSNNIFLKKINTCDNKKKVKSMEKVYDEHSVDWIRSQAYNLQLTGVAPLAEM